MYIKRSAYIIYAVLGGITILIGLLTWLSLPPRAGRAEASLSVEQNPQGIITDSITRSITLTSPPQAFLEYQVYGGSIITDTTMPPVLPGGQADYAEIYAEHNLCALITSGQVQEVWIWTGDGDGITKGNMWEWTASGQEWHGDAPDCGSKVVTTFAFNYLREVDVALESYNHKAETFFSHYFMCDFATATWPWAGSTTWPYSTCGELLSDRYGFVARPFEGNDDVGGCGDAHHPPNIMTNDDYIYDDPTTVNTICPSWSEDGSAQPTSLNCEAWGCTHWGFHIWWMQNVPGLNNTNRDRYGNLHPNWWAYLFGTPTTSKRGYLPFISLQPGGNLKKAERKSPPFVPYTKPGYATAPENGLPLADDRAVSGKTALHSPSSLASQPAFITPTVYVLFYPGYGGTPRADVNLLTTELIGLLKESTVYHGYNYATFRGTFLGQDGQSYAGRNCEAGSAPDNIHIRLNGLKTDVQPIAYQVEDPAGGGVWANPCDPVSSWLLYVNQASPDQADLYFKPFRDAPEGTQYEVTVYYSDGTTDSISLIGAGVYTLVGVFLGQDGQSYAGEGCSAGTVPDNIHIHMEGLKAGVLPVGYRVEDPAGGAWAYPCDPVSSWLVYVITAPPNQAELYFKPYRDAPDGTLYLVYIYYADGTSQMAVVVGTHVAP